jgi:hypothetical protein
MFGITASILIFIAVSIRINTDNEGSYQFIYTTPVVANTPNIQFYESTATPHPGVNNNPWGYDFNRQGDYIYDQNTTNFCKYFKCASDFWNNSRNGYIVECNDEDYTRTGGYASVCDGHGGEKQALYWHP